MLVLLLVMNFQFMPVQAESVDSKMMVEEQETGEVVEKKMNVFEELHYRMFLKDTRDFFDYVLLAIFIVGLLIVLVFKNTHYVVVQKYATEQTFLESPATYSVEELVEEPKEEVAEIVEEVQEENPEILSSELLEEEKKEVPNKKTRKKKRA